MKSEAWIPIVVGVTGHRSIRQADRPALYAAVREELSKLRARCSHSLFVMLSSLGGDLCRCAQPRGARPLGRRKRYGSGLRHRGRGGLCSQRQLLSDIRQLYKKMSTRLKEHGQTEEQLTVLAREELMENGNWCSYQRDNAPDISL